MSGIAVNYEADLLTKGHFQSVAVRVSNKCPVSYRRTRVFCIAQETPLRAGECAQAVHLAARGYGHAKMGDWKQRMRHNGTLDQHDREWPGAITKLCNTRALMHDPYCRETSVESCARFKVRDWQGDVSEAEVGHLQRLHGRATLDRGVTVNNRLRHERFGLPPYKTPDAGSDTLRLRSSHCFLNRGERDRPLHTHTT
jgi:hypothetical protein